MATSFLKQPRRGKTHEGQLTPHKRSVVWGVSHKRSAVIVLLLAAVTLVLTSCDPGYDEDMVIRNESSQTVTVIPGTRDCATSELGFDVGNKTYTLAPSEEVVIQSNGGIGSASLEEAIATFMQYYGDSVTFRFAGEPEQQIVFFRTDTTGISPYNFNSIHYKYEEKHHYGLWFNGHPSYGKLTFTITDEHYEK